MKNLFWILVFALGFVATDLCFAEKDVYNRKYDARTFIDIDHMFDERVKSGFHPYKVTIRNGRAAPIIWTIRFDTTASSFDYTSTHQIRVEPGEEVIRELLVPSPPTKGYHYSSYRRVEVSVIAPGLPTDSPRPLGGSVDQNWPSIVMSKALATRNLSRLASSKKSKKKGQEHFASTFRDLPSNWKGLTCVDVMLIDESTWRALPKQQKRAAMTWVRFGGRMDLYTDKEGVTLESLGFGKPDLSKDGTQGRYSLGTVGIKKWNGQDLPDKLVDQYSRARQFDTAYEKDFGKTWEMITRFGTKDFNPFLVFILLIIFAVLVGPVNLFHFAKAGQRHRLFITTPIISLIASLVIIFIILVQDGMGGSGRRVAFVDLQSGSDQRQVQILQHQISRTGVMLRSGFANKEIPGVTPVLLPPSRWNPINNGQHRDSKYEYRSDNFQGDLFRSRSEQGFHIRTVRPTRSRIEIRAAAAGGEPPQLFSSLEFGLKDFYYVDANREVWKTAPGATIESGQKILLQKSDSSELQSWLNETTETVAQADRRQIQSLRNANRYFGVAANPGPLMVETHDAIRWKDDLAIVSGVAVEP